MKHLGRALIGHQFEERLQINAIGQGIDYHLFIGGGHLDQTQVRPEGRLAHELGVDCHKIRLRNCRTGSGQFVSIFDYAHDPLI